MAINKGWNGKIAVSDKEIGYTNNWEVSFSGDALEKTAFGDTVHDRSFMPGLRAHTITFSGYFDENDSGQADLLDEMKSGDEAQSVVFQCFPERTGPGWTGDAVITGITVSTPIDGLAAISGTLQISGGLRECMYGEVIEGIKAGDDVEATT